MDGQYWKDDRTMSTNEWLLTSGPIFCLLLGISSGYAWPITWQVTSVTCPVISWANSELTPSKRQKMGPDFWQFLEPWHGRWYEYKIFIASCTDNIYDLENERWLLGNMIDHVGIYGSRVAEGLPASNVGLVCVSFLLSFFLKLIVACRWCVIYVREDNDCNVKGYDYMACMDYMDPMSAVPRKAVKLNHALTYPQTVKSAPCAMCLEILCTTVVLLPNLVYYCQYYVIWAN